MTTWRNLVVAEMKRHGDMMGNTVGWACDLKADEYDEDWQRVPPDLHFHNKERAPNSEWGWLDREFDDGWGGIQGHPFTLWTESRVYFPVTYDGKEWCASVPRHPCVEPSQHHGGG